MRLDDTPPASTTYIAIVSVIAGVSPWAMTRDGSEINEPLMRIEIDSPQSQIIRFFLRFGATVADRKSVV